MSWQNKVVWSEGMFLRPQHFQQDARAIEALVESRTAPLRCFSWGFTELRLDNDLLKMGKLAVQKARGVFPDGTPFSIPDHDDTPSPLGIGENVRDRDVYLALPLRRSGAAETAAEGHDARLARGLPYFLETRDSNAGTPGTADIQVAKLNTRLITGSENRDEFACLRVGRVVERRGDQSVVLDDQVIPPVLDSHAASTLYALLVELQGLLAQRAEALAGRVSAAGRGGTAEIGDFLMLQVVNRATPLIDHMVRTPGIHPEQFFSTAIQLAGELATFTAPDKLPAQIEPYRHEALEVSFRSVFDSLRRALSMVLEQNAVRLPLEERKYGVWVSPIADRKLAATASHVLAVAADMPTEDLRQRLPSQIKIGTVEKIRDLVNLQLNGIPLRALPVAPRQIPYHAGLVYFELDRSDRMWAEVADSGGFAMHVGGEFPGITMQFWAIRG
jgi:type VI secretion system protein ImpJ